MVVLMKLMHASTYRIGISITVNSNSFDAQFFTCFHHLQDKANMLVKISQARHNIQAWNPRRLRLYLLFYCSIIVLFSVYLVQTGNFLLFISIVLLLYCSAYLWCEHYMDFTQGNISFFLQYHINTQFCSIIRILQFR